MLTEELINDADEKVRSLWVENKKVESLVLSIIWCFIRTCFYADIFFVLC